jgi:hypothetical protein
MHAQLLPLAMSVCCIRQHRSTVRYLAHAAACSLSTVLDTEIDTMDDLLLLQRYVESEILNHSTLRHPHVVQFREVFLSPNHVSVSLCALHPCVRCEC